MKDGRASETAVVVTMGRAAAHGRTTVSAYADPTARALLRDDERALVDRYRDRVGPSSIHGAMHERVQHAYIRAHEGVMVARTVWIDDAVRGHADPMPRQLVILGAGLDGRAWRLPLADTVVFEVDHPDSQRDKRARLALARELTTCAREVRFVPVDLRGRSSALDDALERAGHDQSAPTTWLCEGVVMYLTRADVAAMLAVMQARSAGGSRAIVAYHAPAVALLVVGLLVRLSGEPLRSSATPAEMRALLERHDFHVVSDEDMRAIGASVGVDGAQMGRFIAHGRIAVADVR